ncbi:MAG: glutamate-5-semialdehyde dehydrogenase [Pelolinea sp.]|nr:glutamate-5-semialdehyde dehydrogenase [Pelolinea sp.]
MLNVESICRRAKKASRSLALVSRVKKDKALALLSDWLLVHQDEIVRENEIDIKNGTSSGLSPAMIDRLTLSQARIQSMADDLKNVIRLPDPVGEVLEEKDLENGLHIKKQRVPLGVLAVIYESRPNVTIDVASLALKSGNAVIMRGGKETIHSNQILVAGIHSALNAAGIDPEIVQFIGDPDRKLVEDLLTMYKYVDMLIPRGGAGLHQYCRERSTIPVITGGIGICHLFVDEGADQDRSLAVIRNAKIQRPTVCNALDTVLIHQLVAENFVTKLIDYLREDGVSFRLDEKAFKFLPDENSLDVKLAKEGDFDTEWLSLVLGIKIVDGIDEAIQHIFIHSTGHSDGILTQNEENAERFIAEVDSAAVYVNASTRFTDGSQLGLGAEVAISTQRLHARGPMALRELTIYKWVISGDYKIRK